MSTLTELVEKVADRIGFDRDEAWAVCEELFVEMSKQINAGEAIKIRGFGSFDWVLHKARARSHPRTGEKLQVPAKQVLKFKPATALVTRRTEDGKVWSQRGRGKSQTSERGDGTRKVSLVREGTGFRWRLS